MDTSLSPTPRPAFSRHLTAIPLLLVLAAAMACEGPSGLNGKDGDPGADGKNGVDGTNGKDGAKGSYSIYRIADAG